MQLIEKTAELRDTCCKMVEELATLRKQLSDQARELGVLEGKAEMWQQRAEIAEAKLNQGGRP